MVISKDRSMCNQDSGGKVKGPKLYILARCRAKHPHCIKNSLKKKKEKNRTQPKERNKMVHRRISATTTRKQKIIPISNTTGKDPKKKRKKRLNICNHHKSG